MYIYSKKWCAFLQKTVSICWYLRVISSKYISKSKQRSGFYAMNQKSWLLRNMSAASCFKKVLRQRNSWSGPEYIKISIVICGSVIMKTVLKHQDRKLLGTLIISLFQVFLTQDSHANRYHVKRLKQCQVYSEGFQSCN